MAKDPTRGAVGVLGGVGTVLRGVNFVENFIDVLCCKERDGCLFLLRVYLWDSFRYGGVRHCGICLNMICCEQDFYISKWTIIGSILCM